LSPGQIISPLREFVLVDVKFKTYLL
jgi:hypothetical protein